MNKKKNFQRIRIITKKSEVKQLINNIEVYGLKVIKLGIGGDYKTLNEYKAKNSYTSIKDLFIIEQTDTKIKVTTYYGFEFCKPCTYVFNLNNEPDFVVKGQKTFAEFSKTMDIPNARPQHDKETNTTTNYYKETNRFYDEETGKFICSAKPIIDYNVNYEYKELTNCYEYDINSAYSAQMLDKMPDLSNPIYYQKVKKNQVGFLFDDELTLIETGYADIIFNLIDTPNKVKNYIFRWYNRKNTSEGTEKKTAKAYLNLPIGYCQRYNPFLRAYVIHKCNKYIKSIIDKNTLFWNTDAIFSLTKRDDLNIGTNIGQFKEKACKSIKYIGNTYQINDEIPVYRGIPKAWFKHFEEQNNRPFNILTDELPERFNYYNWNWNKLEVEVNDEKVI